MGMNRVVLCWVLAAFAVVGAAQAPVMPETAGETLSGKKIVLADAVRGHAVVPGGGLQSRWRHRMRRLDEGDSRGCGIGGHGGV